MTFLVTQMTGKQTNKLDTNITPSTEVTITSADVSQVSQYG